MSIHRQAASIVAADGLTGLLRRGAGKVFRSLTGRPHPNARRDEADRAERAQRAAAEVAERAVRAERVAAEVARQEREAAKQDREAAHLARQKVDYAALVERFPAEVRRRNLGDIDAFYWYHTIDLGDGLATPGDYDYRDRLADYPFPESMRGMKVLDIGSATGFFAFEFERRGGDVTSVELPSMEVWDMITAEREVLLEKSQKSLGTANRAETFAELNRLYVHGPFDFCHRARGSRVRRCLSRIYDLTPEKLGNDQFDMIFLGDVIGHLFSPLAALNALAPLCRGEMIISLDLVDLPGASIQYSGGAVHQPDDRSWFQPNWEGLRQMLRRVGFKSVELVGQSHVMVRREWIPMKRDLIRAVK